MSVFAWRRRATRHFGEQWVPFAELRLRSAAGRWQAFSVQVDTGAVISVLTRSAADLLGIDLTKGEAIDLSGIGAEAQRYFIHTFAARVGDRPEMGMRIAIAEGEDVPNLLGRLDVLDRFQIDLDSSLEETRITASWLDESGRRLWRHFLEVEAVILSKWSDNPLPGRVDDAARRFLNRADQLVGAGAGLLKLHRGFELPLVLRSLFELSVQFEYLMRDPETRAELYLEFEYVTHHRSEQAWLNLPGAIGDYLRASPDRIEAEPRIRNAYERVRGRYGSKMHWYPGTLLQRANDVGRTAEYKAIYALYSAWAHGDPWASRLLKIGHGGLLESYSYWARLLIQIADAKKMILTGEAYDSLVKVSKGLTAT